jgi:hypothetical protein
VTNDPTGRQPTTVAGYEYASAYSNAHPSTTNPSAYQLPPYPLPYQGSAYQPRGGAVPVPVVGPVIGVAASTLCLLAGCWLVLAPFALGLAKHGQVPRAAAVDWASGGALALVALLTAALFCGCLRRRLRAAGVLRARRRPGTDSASVEASHDSTAADDAPGAETSDASDGTPLDDLADRPADLHELLAPLVSALTADLRARQTSGRAGAGGRGSDSAGEC